MSENDLAQRAKENGDKPAHPEAFGIYPNEKGEPDLGYRVGGLTKREEFAKAAMVGLMRDYKLSEHDTGHYAVLYADALLLALEKTKA